MRFVLFRLSKLWLPLGLHQSQQIGALPILRPSIQIGILEPGALSDKEEIEKARGPESKRIRGPFSLSNYAI